MKTMRVSRSSLLLDLSRMVDSIASDIHDEHKEFMNAFFTAHERWKDKNAQTCETALNRHSDAMSEALNQLESISDTLKQLGEIASEYEEI